MLDEGEDVVPLPAYNGDHVLQDGIGVLPCQNRVQPLVQQPEASVEGFFSQIRSFFLQHLSITHQTSQLLVKYEQGVILGEGITKLPHLTQNVGHARLFEALDALVG